MINRFWLSVLLATAAPQYPLHRYRDPPTGKWRKARYRAEVDVIRERHSEYEIIGEPMVITGPTHGTFNPYRRKSHRDCE